MVDLQGLEDGDTIVDVSSKTVCRWITNAAERLAEKTGDDGWTYLDVHDLRRSWGTHVLAEGVLPSVVMSWGSWEDWETLRSVMTTSTVSPSS